MKKIRKSQRKHLAKSYRKKHFIKTYRKKHFIKTYKKHKFFSQKGGSSHPATEDDIRNAFGLALNGQTDRLFELVRPLGPVPINQVRNDGMFAGYTLLHAAAFRNQTSVVQRLLSEGADPSLLVGTQTASDIATLRGNEESAQIIDDWVRDHPQ